MIYLKAFVLTFLTIYNFASGKLLLTSQNYLAEKFRKAAQLLDTSAVETKWMQQPVDHFNDSDTREWSMKYFKNLENWQTGGPIYLYIQGEGRARSECLLTGLPFELAAETNGALWSTEHRYYGDSQPFNDLSVENLQYLSSKQALADIKNLLKQIKQSTEYASSKVVVIGGSYAGNLAAWMRRLYPDLVDAAISSSAPVLAKVNFFEYLDTVADDFKKYCDPESFDKLTKNYDNYKNLLKTENGIKQLKEEFNICEETDLTRSENKVFFFEYISYNLMKTAQYGNTDDIKTLCDEGLVLKSADFFIGDCLDLDFSHFFKPNNNHTNWYYQVCTEFGYFMTSPINDLFSNTTDLDYYYKMCSSLYGSDFNEARVENGVKKSNELYGGLNPNVTNVVFVNGEIDPWHRLGIIKNLSDNAPAIVIPRASHCNDLFSPETEEIKKAREQEKTYIKKWINFETNNN